MDAISLLKEQHREAEALMRQIEKADDIARLPLIEQLADALTVHTEIEEQIFYPGIKHKETEELLKDSFQEHAEVKTKLAILAEAEPGEGIISSTFQQMANEVRHHLHEEETQLFPTVQRVFDREALERMGERMMKLAEKLEAEESPSDRIAELPTPPSL